MSAPRHLLKAWPKLRRQLAERHRVLLTDFDGTLSPVARHPSIPKMPPQMAAALRRIARRDVVGIVTGRTLRDIRRRAGIRGIWYAGSHGYEVCSPNGRPRLRLSAREQRVVAAVTRAVKRRLGGLPGLTIEAKPAMVAVHYREARGPIREQVNRVVHEIAGRQEGAQLMQGKKVWDLGPRRPKGKGGKWAAVQLILRAVARRKKGQWVVAYIGDDLTDEQVFQHLRGISVVVGKRKRTAARYFLNSPREVARFLTAWEEL